MRRRRIRVAIVALLAAGGLIAWRCMPRHDERLVGHWMARYSPNSNSTEGWEIRNDGTGMRTWRLLEVDGRSTVTTPNESFLWQTDGNTVSIRFGASATGWERIREVYRHAVHGIDRRSEQFPAYVYTYAIDHDSNVRLEPHDLVVHVEYDAIMLTPNPEGNSP